MKRILSLVVCLFLVYSLAGCVDFPPDNASSASYSIVTGEPVSDGLYSLSLPVALKDCAGALISGRYFIISGNDSDMAGGIFVWDMQSGAVSRYMDLETGRLYALEGGAVGLVTARGAVYRMESPSSTPVLLAAADDISIRRFFSNGCYCSCSESVLSFFGPDGMLLSEIDVGGKYDYFYPRCSYGFTAYFTAGCYGIEQKIIAADMLEGSYTESSGYGISGNTADCGGIFVSKTENLAEIDFFNAESGALKLAHGFRTVSRYETPLNCCESFVATSYYGYDGARLAVYDVGGQLRYFAPGISADDTGFIATSFFDGGRLYLCSADYVEGITQWYYIDTAELPVLDFPDLGEPEGYPDGITVLSGDKAILDFPDFSAQPLDENDSIIGVAAVNACLDKFPEGFFDELLGSGSECRSLVICVTGKLTPLSDQSIDNPAAYAYYDDGSHFIALSANGNYLTELESTLSHELMHVIDNYFVQTGKAPYDSWNDYLPDGFSYFNSYRSEDGGEINDFGYTTAGETDINNVYFPMTYNRTFAIEDRAVLFSLAFTHNPYYVTFPRIKDRMDYLISVLRENFTSVARATDVYWE